MMPYISYMNRENYSVYSQARWQDRIDYRHQIHADDGVQREPPFVLQDGHSGQMNPEALGCEPYDSRRDGTHTPPVPMAPVALGRAA